MTVGDGSVGAGKVTFDGLTVTTFVDQATPQLMTVMAPGAIISDGELIVPDRRGDVSLPIEREAILVTGISTRGPVDDHPGSEDGTLQFETSTITVDDEAFTWDSAAV